MQLYFLIREKFEYMRLTIKIYHRVIKIIIIINIIKEFYLFKITNIRNFIKFLINNYLTFICVMNIIMKNNIGDVL